MNKRVFWSSLIGIILFLITSGFIDENSEISVIANEQNGAEELTHEQIVHMTDEFIQLFNQATGEYGLVCAFHSKEELYNEIEKIAFREAAIEYVDFYYTEKEEGLYLLPTELPPWFNKENNYDRIRTEEDTVKIIQQNTMDLYGEYTIEITFTYDTKWKISEVVHR